MNLLSRHAITTDVFVDRLAVLLVVAEGIEDLGECEVGQPPDDFFWSNAEFPQLGDRAHRGASTRHDGGSVENLFGADNVGMACCGRHDKGLPKGVERSICFPGFCRATVELSSLLKGGI